MKRRCNRAIRELIAAISLVCFFVCSCDENPADSDKGAEIRVTVSSGNNQIERVGATLPEPLIARVTNMLGTPQAGIIVTFRTDEPGAAANPAQDISDAQGYASCAFRLGPVVGQQHVMAKIATDSTIFKATAEAIGCPEEEISKIGFWDRDHIYITTTSSSLLDAGETVLIDFDTETKSIEKVLETREIITDLSFSPRGDLYLASGTKILKFDTLSLDLVEFAALPATWSVELEPNPGGILTGLHAGGPFKVDCPSEGISLLAPGAILLYLRKENLAVDPVTRDYYIINGQSPPIFSLWRALWDGRYISNDAVLHATINAGAANPAGMCIDTTGTVYITFNGTQNDRSIVSVSQSGVVDAPFFDFYEHYGRNDIEAGQWGDLAYLEGRLYIIDTRNDRLVVIAENGDFVEEISDEAFSTPQSVNERYGIATLPH
jgi:hypothetical protein